MFRKGRSKNPVHRNLLALVLLTLLSLGLFTRAIASPAAQVEPEAGTWETWVLDSGDQFRLDAPPDAAATGDEVAQLKEMVSQRDDAALNQIAYWNAGAPAYRWNQIAIDEMMARGMPGNMAFRDLALLHVAIY